MRQEGEPSVEEILESIKRVIERDSRDAVQSVARRAPEASAFPMDPVDDAEADEILDLGEAGLPLSDDEDEGPESETLTNVHAADAMRQSLAALAMLSEPPARPQIVRSGETSLEGMVREMLRPMLAQWLDAHLPNMVERLVKAEIARIAGKKR
ncbi:DUF2497 domain-containing protein [Aurantiacibacter marinus]|uniref:Pole-organizing protein PopZ n=1 Tax=Aurantiacibacter marinus TaxID=874156 RepID=A0A0H0XQT8_9SPHN|nr:DUF2497 domain-containing protein [Aurantiacibacter marinus]KLI64729.1 hypothetical protein AAV99_04150 [Aurantiacibacter marinus]